MISGWHINSSGHKATQNYMVANVATIKILIVPEISLRATSSLIHYTNSYRGFSCEIHVGIALESKKLAVITTKPQQVELIMTHSSISSIEQQLNFCSKNFYNCLLIMKITKIRYYKNLVLYGVSFYYFF